MRHKSQAMITSGLPEIEIRFTSFDIVSLPPLTGKWRFG
jgi:hypothetical protein